MDIALITGASSGMGLEFFKELLERNETFDEIWVVSRSKEKLEKLQELTKIKVRAIALDLSLEESYLELENLLKEYKPQIKYLILASGFGKFNSVKKTKLKELTNMVQLNCNGVLGVSKVSLPYLKEKSVTMIIASVAAFEPIPYIATYAGTKAFVLSYTRALNQELRKENKRAMAICPFWTKTAFFDRADAGNGVVKKYAVMYKPEQIVKKAFKDLKKKNKDVSIYGAYTRFQCFLVKILPHKLVMKVWMRQQKLNK